MKTVIYTQRVQIVEEYGERRDCADQRLAKFLYHCDFMPVPVPNVPELIERFMSEIRPRGIVLSGGNSLGKYDGDAPERDARICTQKHVAGLRHLPRYAIHCRLLRSKALAD